MIAAAPIPAQQLDPIGDFPVPLVKPLEKVIDEQPQVSEPVSAPVPTPLPTTPSLAPSTASTSPLEELLSLDRLFITKRLRVKNVLFLRGKKNKFFVRTPDHKILYTVEEENSWWVGYFFYGLRPLQLKVSNTFGEEIMRIERPYACTTRVMPCQLQNLTVYSPPGNLLGTIEQKWTFIKPLYVVNNREGVPVFWIFGPMITISCYSDVSFSIARADGSPAGSSRKRWQGLMHALFFSPITDKFGVAFDMNLTMEEKGLLLAATLLLHYMYYDA